MYNYCISIIAAAASQLTGLRGGTARPVGQVGQSPAVLSPHETAKMIYGSLLDGGCRGNNVFSGPSRPRLNWVSLLAKCKGSVCEEQIESCSSSSCLLFLILLGYRGLPKSLLLTCIKSSLNNVTVFLLCLKHKSSDKKCLF